MNHPKQALKDQDEIRRFYNSVYYKDATAKHRQSRHYARLASKINIHTGQRVLDVACGNGQWLAAVKARGGIPAGIDLSEKAIDLCRSIFPDGELYAGTAEELPFADKRFHFVSCLGALEHFLDPHKALQEMMRTARDDAYFLLLVPNKDFLTCKLGLFSGTGQSDIREEVRTLPEWQKLFESVGLEIIQRWKDLHILTWSWINANRWYHVPMRAAQALVLAVWPLSWQYQVYHLCRKRGI